MPAPASHRTETPSSWVVRHAPLIRAGGTVLDLACGFGRHSRHLTDLSLRVEAVDRDAEAIAGLRSIAGITARLADLEQDSWPFGDRRFDAVVVTNYLWRPLFPVILEALEAHGVLLYETFALGNDKFGKPSNPDFLLRPGELLALVGGRLRVVAFEDLYLADPKPAMVQRICAVGPTHPGTAPVP